MYTRLLTKLSNFLQHYYISVFITDIFENTLLRLANVATSPVKCEFGVASTDDESELYFLIKGINEEDANHFLNFLKKYGEDECANKLFIPSQTINFLGELHDAYFFVIKTNAVIDNLLPLFKAEIIRLDEHSSEILTGYQKQSEQDHTIKECKLLETLLKQFNELENNCQDDFTKGELHIVFNNLKSNIAYQQKLRLLDDDAHRQLIEAALLFMNLCKENKSLQDNQAFMNLKEDLLSYCDLTAPNYYIANDPVMVVTIDTPNQMEEESVNEQDKFSLYPMLSLFSSPSSCSSLSSDDSNLSEEINSDLEDSDFEGTPNCSSQSSCDENITPNNSPHTPRI